MLSASYPRRVLTVTGRSVFRLTASITRYARSGSSSSALPSPEDTTLRAGQPMLISSDVKRPSAVTFAAASPITDGSLPKSWQAVLLSSGCTASRRR